MPKPTTRLIRPWTFAGIMLSYWCNARCRSCYVCCSPQAPHWVDPVEAVRWWRELDELAHHHGKTMRIHLTGGEPFGNWPLLLEIAQRAFREGLTKNGAFQKVETNAFWATDPAIVRQRLSLLNELGMTKLAVSTDPYHQEFVDPACVRTCVETARHMLGPDRVQVRWLDWYEQIQDLRHMPVAQKEGIFARAYAAHRERLTGRAAIDLTPSLEAHPCSHWTADDCAQPLLAGKHVHVDPYGNVFPGVCAGIILGNALQSSMASIFHDSLERSATHPVVNTLAEGGPELLHRYAQILGFTPRPEGYAGKCQLCTDIRSFLFHKHVFDGRLGPAEVYRG